MKLSVKSDYAARAVLGLARQFPSGQAVRADDVAAEQMIPVNYLVQILIELKSAQIVRSVRGKEGGYLLARPPAEITWARLSGPFMASFSTRRRSPMRTVRLNCGKRGARSRARSMRRPTESTFSGWLKLAKRSRKCTTSSEAAPQTSLASS